MLQPQNRSQRYDELFVGIDRGSIKIPKFQREFVWSKEQTAALIDSLIKGFPIGAFTYWETTDELRQVKEIGNHPLPTVPTGHPVFYVLDGQQRITSLYAVRKGVTYDQQHGSTIDYRDISIDLSLDTDTDDSVVFASPPNTDQNISVYELLNSSLTQIFRNYNNDEQLEKIDKYKSRLEQYSFSLVVIDRRYTIDIATEVFTRINTGGTELKLFEIMVAKTYSEEKNFDLSDEYDRLLSGGQEQDRCLAMIGYDTVDSATVLRCMALHLGSETKRRAILRIDKGRFIDDWPKVKEGIFSAVNFLKNSLRVPVSRLLPYYALLVPLTYFFIRQPNPTSSQIKRLKEYFWWASLSKRFSSAVDTGLASDRHRMDSILADTVPNYRGESIEITQDELINQWFSTADARCKAILCLYAYFRPKSFKTNNEVTVDNSWLQRVHSKNYHHFFPRKYLKSLNIEDWLANSVLNITIVDDYLNKRVIRAKAPSIYINEFSEENNQLNETMRTHLIDDLTKFGVLDNDYDVFLRNRANRVLKELYNRLPAKQ